MTVGHFADYLRTPEGFAPSVSMGMALLNLALLNFAFPTLPHPTPHKPVQGWACRNEARPRPKLVTHPPSHKPVRKGGASA